MTTSLIPNPSWTRAQTIAFGRIVDAIPYVVAYSADEIPVLDNHSLEQLIDETGALKAAKKLVETAEKAHVERLKARLGDKDGHKGDKYEANYRGSKRTILNQGLCKEILEAYDAEGIDIRALLDEIKAGRIDITAECATSAENSNSQHFHTTSDGGRSLYVTLL